MIIRKTTNRPLPSPGRKTSARPRGPGTIRYLQRVLTSPAVACYAESYMSNDKSSQPKTVPASPVAPTASSVPAYVTAIPEGAKVFVLVPADGHERQATLDKLEDALFKYCPELPAVNHEWKIGRLPFGSVILAAHCTTVRAKREDGTYGPVAQLHIGQPVEIDKHRAKAQDGYSFSTDQAGVVDAVVKSCKHTNGVVWLATLSGDPIAEDRVLKLVKS